MKQCTVPIDVGVSLENQRKGINDSIWTAMSEWIGLRSAITQWQLSLPRVRRAFRRQTGCLDDLVQRACPLICQLQLPL